VGNAVSIPVARWVAERIKTPGDVLDFKQVDIREGRRWPDAGWNVGKGRVGVLAGDKPVSVPRPSISEFRDASWSRLTDRALDGFIDRVEEGGLRTPKGFVAALRRANRKTARAA
jgi:DNA (cytosine-5)-methyltransferase 1